LGALLRAIAESGWWLAVGTPAAIQSEPAVRHAYLGESDALSEAAPRKHRAGRARNAGGFVCGPDHLGREDMTLLLVDQMAGLALRLADRAYVIERGRISAHGDANSIRNDTALTQAYLGA
jgi:ABC-type branched-subunit amino acid transport system ATPase component